MTAKDGLLDSEKPGENNQFSKHTLVYFDLEATGIGRNSEVCRIVAHFAEESFLRYVCPIGTVAKMVAKLTGLSKKDGILYLRGERVETVSNIDAWKDFLKFLQSTNNSVVLVIHDRRNECFLLFRDLSELSLMEEFRKLCSGIIVTLPLSKNIFSGSKKTSKNYNLKELAQDNLGKEISAGIDGAIADAINLEKLMKHANVLPKMFQQHFFSLSILEYWYQINRHTILLRKKFPLTSLGLPKEMAKSGITYDDLVRSYVEGGEDGIALFLSRRMKTTDPKAIKEDIIAITPVLEQQFASLDLEGSRQHSTDRYVPPHSRKEVAVNKMTTKDNHENPRGSHHFSEHTLVYFDLEATGFVRSSEVCQIGAYFAEKSFSRYVCPIGRLTKKATKRTGLSKQDGILYLGGERVETVSKMDAWKDFLKFLQSANNSVVLVIYYRHNDSFLLFRDLSELLLIEEFRKVCAGMIDAFPLCRNVFPGRVEIGESYILQELVQDNLGKEISTGSHNAIVDAINLEKLMKHAEVQPETFQQHFFSLSNLEYQFWTDKQTNREKRLLKRKFPFMGTSMAVKFAEAGITYNDLESIYIEGGEDGIASLLSGRMKNPYPKDIRKKAIAISRILSSELDLY
ncbi:uncharacterized protein [Anabrus simplex]